MGNDLDHQAMIDGCELLERARRDPEFGSDLEFFHNRATAPRPASRRSRTQAFDDFEAESRRVMEAHPGIEHRYVNLHRHFDMLLYLLSADRRRDGNASRWPAEPSGWVERAIFGGAVLNPATQTTVGVPIRYLSPPEVVELAAILAATPPESLRLHWDPPRMNEVGIYKFHGHETDANYAHLQADFEALRDYYARVAAHGEGSLAFMS